MGWENFRIEERQQYDHDRYMADRERRLAASKEYWKAHREAINRKRREWYKRKCMERWERNT